MSRGVKFLRSKNTGSFAIVLLVLVHAVQVLNAGAIEPTVTVDGATRESDNQSTPSAPRVVGDRRVDVRTEVWPIFQRHCLRCHSGEKSDGDLRLDEIDFIRQGGHTGNAILGSAENSELLRRIVSMDPGYRMPKESEPLSTDEVQVLTRWVQQGASWPANESANPGAALSTQTLTTLPSTTPPPATTNSLGQAASRDPSWQAWSSQLLDVVSEYQQPMRPLLICFLFFGVFVLLVERRKREAGDSDPTAPTDWSRRINHTHYLIILLGFVWTGTVLFYRVHQERLQQRYDELAKKYQAWTKDSTAVANRSGPYRLNHPPRMGGTYYRGNDERNEQLFNRGFYSTAIMFLSLRDKHRDSLSWNDSPDPESLAVCLEIERAPFATPELFNDQTMTSCFLRLVNDGEVYQATEQRAQLQTVAAGERWRACYPLVGHATVQGSESRYKGGIDLCNNSGHPHYGIRYDILVEGGRIADESELWMGATFLTGNVVIPQEGTIPLREWFDFVPIPEITKEHSKDRELLGITEHLGAEPSDNTTPAFGAPAEQDLKLDDRE